MHSHESVPAQGRRQHRSSQALRRSRPSRNAPIKEWSLRVTHAGNDAVDVTSPTNPALAGQKLSAERIAITQAFGRKLPSLFRTPPPGRMMYCSSGWTIHHAAKRVW